MAKETFNKGDRIFTIMTLKQELEQITSDNPNIITLVVNKDRSKYDVISFLRNEKFRANDIKDYKHRKTVHKRINDIIKYVRFMGDFNNESYVIFHYGTAVITSDKLAKDYNIYYRCDNKPATEVLAS